MSLRRLCSQRTASTCAHPAVWRQRDVRCHSSKAANDPEWFQQLRAGLLSRNPIYQREDLDSVHHAQLLTTLGGFVPRIRRRHTVAQFNSPVAHLLTRFNLQVLSAKLLPDGTDPLHSPGEPWVRRMWAGGAVQLNPDVNERTYTVGLQSKVACVERIKDVRLQGKDGAAKIFVTIERRFALVDRLEDRARSQPGGLDAETYMMQQVRDGLGWGDALLKEERNLVFLKAKTDAETMAIQAGETHIPRYLKAPTDPDFTHTLTPTRSLIFRYSALTFNAHLIHLDPTYARNVEGHRNLLVHGPLTLTLMLQTLTKHLLLSEVSAKTEVVESVSYRNLAPLYCDEEMRICVKKKTRVDAANAWDVWIEGPTGGMAVKATVRTVNRGKKTPATEHAVEPTTSTSLPDVKTVAVHARDSLNALDRKDSTTEQLSQLSRNERRKLWRTNQRELSRSQRKAWAARPLPYLYFTPSPLSIHVLPPTQVHPGTPIAPVQGAATHSTAAFQRLARSPQNQSNPPLRIRRVGTSTPAADSQQPALPVANLENQLPVHLSSPTSASPHTSRPPRRSSRRPGKLVIRKIEQVRVRKTGDALGSVERRGKQKTRHVRRAGRIAMRVAGKREGVDVDVDVDVDTDADADGKGGDTGAE